MINKMSMDEYADSWAKSGILMPMFVCPRCLYGFFTPCAEAIDDATPSPGWFVRCRECRFWMKVAGDARNIAFVEMSRNG
mgnify:CR=1 FL=1